MVSFILAGCLRRYSSASIGLEVLDASSTRLSVPLRRSSTTSFATVAREPENKAKIRAPLTPQKYFKGCGIHMHKGVTSIRALASSASSSSQLVFVTGASGFLGSHITLQLLGQGYRVRAAVRGAKLDLLKKLYAKYGEQIEFVIVSDIATGQLSEALKGVSSVIHTAAPLPTRDNASAEDMLRIAIDGTLNVVREANQAGITKIIVTSTIATSPKAGTGDSPHKVRKPVSREQAAGMNGMAAYTASKTIAERDLWAYADENPHLDITTINPPFIYGPFAETFRIQDPSVGAMSSMGILYALLFPEGTHPPSPHYADVRDVAKAHVLALKAPVTSSVGRKRVVFASPFDMDFKAMYEIVKKKRTDAASRWTQQKMPKYPSLRLDCDFARIQEVVGMKETDFISAEDTLLRSIDSLLAVEKEWVENHGYTPALPGVVTNTSTKAPPSESKL